MSRQKARVYKMRPNAPRIVHSILHVITEAQKRRVSVTQYDIVKTIFLADRKHLNRFGRPITFDKYVAMKFGPVPSTVYDLLKEHRRTIEALGLRELPWKRSRAPEISDTSFKYEQPAHAPSDEILSQSDVDELSAALTVVKSLGFHQIKKLTHEDQAYIDAWEDESEHSQFPMSYTLLFDVPNEEKAKELSFISEHL